MKGALDVHRALLDLGIQHEVVRLRGTVASGDDLPRALGVETGSCAVVRCYVTDVGTGTGPGALTRTAGTGATGGQGSAPGQGFAAALVQAGALPDPAALLDALGAHALRMATPDEVNRMTDYAAALVSPVCLPPELPLLADSALGASEVLYCPLGESGVALGIHTRDLLAAVGARVAALTPSPLPGGERDPWAGGARVIDLEGRSTNRRPPRRHVG